MTRYDYCWNKTLLSGAIRKLPRGVFRFQKYPDTIEYSCKNGDTLFTLAGKYYHESFPFPSLLYWVIADFQPTPIIDPTVVFEAGHVIYIPSIKVINLYINTAAREPEFETW